MTLELLVIQDNLQAVEKFKNFNHFVLVGAILLDGLIR